MIRGLSITVAIALIASAQAWAAEPAGTNAPASTSVKPGRSTKPDTAKPAPGDKLICTREQQADSFIPKRICRTQAQIDEERRVAERMNDDRLSQTRGDLGR